MFDVRHKEGDKIRLHHHTQPQGSNTGGLLLRKREIIVEKYDRAFSFGSFDFDSSIRCANSDGRFSLLAVVFNPDGDRFVFHGESHGRRSSPVVS